MVANLHTPPRRKFPANTWLWDFHPKHQRWESYKQPSDWDPGLWDWLWNTLGHPGTDPGTGVYSGWDYHGGWLYIYREDYLALFKLKWS